ncbi:glycine/D-amino acid oxidase-like deaminating enzyme [Bradyrhizobium sp. F1.4.3]|uniref:NAD(P)/FAD-dependent oxidoreductase n=1 Tax=unclassified Bradyrhizobium TaxID=2631580 RepID=UPI00339602A4
MEPDLDPGYTFAVAVEGTACIDPGSYVAALARHAVRAGAQIIRGRATGFRIESGRLKAVRTIDGEVFCDRAVISAGAWSKQLTAALGDRIFLESERGYHVIIRNPEIRLKHLILFTDPKLATTSTRSGIRVTGQVELAGLRAKPNWKRAHVLRGFALNAYPGLPRKLPNDRQMLWMDIICGAKPVVDPAPYSPRRFAASE